MMIAARLSFCAWVVCLLGSRFCFAGAHPTLLDANSNCLECHQDYASGKYVHAAVSQGCTTCHKIDNREGVTYVALRQTKSIICIECHQAERAAYEHFPYAAEMCTRCHTLHSSANPRLLRANMNEVCLHCHLRTPNSAPSSDLPTIELTSDHHTGHPYVRHPVSGSADPLSGGEMSCASCHRAHGGTQAHLLKAASEIPEDALNHNTQTQDMCRKCHMRLWGLDAMNKGKNRKH
jgi:predicted CXXCH cytochrome family protein